MIEWYDERLSVLRDVNVHHVVIEIKVFDLNVHQAPLPHACAEKEICHHPALVFGKGAFLDIGFLQKQLQFSFVVGFDMAFINLDRLHLEVWNIALAHKEMQGRDQIAQIGIDADVVVKRCLEVQNIVLVRRLVDILNSHLRIKVFIEMQITLPIMPYGSLSQISLPAML